MSLSELITHIQKRPEMYIGYRGFTGFCNLLSYLLDDLLDDIGHDGTVKFELSHTDQIRMEIKGKTVAKTLNRFNLPSEFSLGALIALSEFVEIEIINDYNATFLQAQKETYSITTSEDISGQEIIILNFVLDFTIFNTFELNYQHINQLLIKYAYLNPSIKIVSISHQGEFQKNIFAFKNGISGELDALIAGHNYVQPLFRFDVNPTIGNHQYQVSFCYQHLWLAKSYVRSYANHVETYLGGSLVDGVLEGLATALSRAAMSAGKKKTHPPRQLEGRSYFNRCS